jgi:methionyl-tRNA formyltransferase
MYMGTPEFAVPALDALHEISRPDSARPDPPCELVAAVTQPDRPRGRGHKLAPSPVKARATELGIPVLQPDAVRSAEDGADNDPAWAAALADARPDLIVVCAYGKILPKATLTAPRLGCVNIHASLLPKYRGAAPVHRAVEAGEDMTGVTLMWMSEGLDEGDMIASRGMPLGDMNSGEATDALALLGAELFTETLPRILAGTAERTPQDSGRATYAPPVERAEGHIDFSAPAEAVVRKVRAMTPSPGAYAYLVGSDDGQRNGRPDDGQGVKIRILAARTAPPGTAGPLVVTAGDGAAVEITRLQSPAGRPMDAADWLRGHHIDEGAVFR